MVDFMTKFALVGAVVSFALYLGLKHARRIALVSDGWNGNRFQVRNHSKEKAK